MSVDELLDVLQVLLGLMTLVAGTLGGLWAYSRFVVERGLLPPVHFDLECRRVGSAGGFNILDVAMHLANLGSSTLVARNLRVDILYLTAESDRVEFLRGPGKAGRLVFPGSLVKDLKLKPEERIVPKSALKKKEAQPLTTRGFAIVADDRFVQPGVNQRFSFVTALPQDASVILVWGAFEYGQRPSRLQSLVLWVSRRLGLIQFTLAHIQKPHTAERVFGVG